MADMKFHCPHCEQTLIIDEQYAGQICECPELVLNIAYDVLNLTDPERRAAYHGPECLLTKYSASLKRSSFAQGCRGQGG